MPVTPRRGVARLYQSDLRPPAGGTASFFLRDLDFGFGRRSPACVVIRRKRGCGGAGEMGHASQATEPSAHDIRRACPGHFSAASHTLLPYLKSRAVCWRSRIRPCGFLVGRHVPSPRKMTRQRPFLSQRRPFELLRARVLRRNAFPISLLVLLRKFVARRAFQCADPRSKPSASDPACPCR